MTRFALPRTIRVHNRKFSLMMFREMLPKPTSAYPELVKGSEPDELKCPILFPTGTQLQEFLSTQAQNLMAGRFQFTVGPASAVICGERGTGKSFGLKHWALRAALLDENLVPAYFEYSPEDIRTPVQILIKALNQRGENLDETTTLEEIERKLLKGKNKAFLILDEVDQVFGLDKNNSVGLKAIQEMSTLGCSSYGQIVTILCGSVSVLPLLISAKARTLPKLAKEYPLATVTPNMNSSKYRSIFFTNNSSKETMRMIVRHFFGCDTNEMVNTVYFCAGTNIRRISTLANDLSNVMLGQNGWDVRAEQTQQEFSALIANINQLLFSKNTHLLAPILDSNISSAEAIKTTDWQTNIRGIPNAEVNDCCQKHGSRIEDVYSLVDKGWFSASDHRISTLLPAFPAALLSSANSPTLPNKMQKILKSILPQSPNSMQFNVNFNLT